MARQNRGSCRLRNCTSSCGFSRLLRARLLTSGWAARWTSTTTRRRRAWRRACWMWRCSWRTSRSSKRCWSRGLPSSTTSPSSCSSASPSSSRWWSGFSSSSAVRWLSRCVCPCTVLLAKGWEGEAPLPNHSFIISSLSSPLTNATVLLLPYRQYVNTSVSGRLAQCSIWHGSSSIWVSNTCPLLKVSRTPPFPVYPTCFLIWDMGSEATESPEAQPQQHVSSLVPCVTQPYLGTSHSHAVGVMARAWPARSSDSAALGWPL